MSLGGGWSCRTRKRSYASWPFPSSHSLQGPIRNCGALSQATYSSLSQLGETRERRIFGMSSSSRVGRSASTRVSRCSQDRTFQVKSPRRAAPVFVVLPDAHSWTTRSFQARRGCSTASIRSSSGKPPPVAKVSRSTVDERRIHVFSFFFCQIAGSEGAAQEVLRQLENETLSSSGRRGRAASYSSLGPVGEWNV